MPNSKALVAALSLFGDPDEIIAKEEIEAEFRIRSGEMFGTEDGDQMGLSESQGNPRNLQLMKQKMSKERIYMLAMKRGVKADPKIFGVIDQIVEDRKEKAKKEQEAETEKKLKEDKTFQRARKIVETVVVEHGVAKFNTKDFLADLTRPLNSVREPPQEI